MKKDIFTTTVLLIVAVFIFNFSFISCKTLPIYTEHFLECEGAPIPLQDLPEFNNINGINGQFPESIYIKTQTQTFSFDYEYLLKDGKIYSKRHGTSSNSWELFQGTGLPFSEKNKFGPVNRIVEIAADADVLYAFSDEGKLYRCYTNLVTHYTPFEWIDYFGWPRKIQLVQNSVLENKKAWAVGSSRLDVQYYTDILGNEHNYGPLGVESIPFLCEDGQTIRYCDPSCPSDFSHTFKGPENGCFVAENLSESASTLFLISKDGTMYTRLVDFNTVGSDPMLYDYSYKEVYSDLSGADPKSNTSIWMLPNEPWKKEPSLPTGAKSTIFITIIQTGHGNNERELRIAAENPEGQTGYYYKKITETEWNFTPAPMNFAPNVFTVSDNIQKNSAQQLQKYTGGLWKNGKKIEDVKCVVNDFHFSEGPFTLEFIGDNFSVDFYISEVWTVFLRKAPGYMEESIRFFGTAIYNEEKLINCENQTIWEAFNNRNKQIHEYHIEAFDSFLKISLNSNNDYYEFYLTENGNIEGSPEIDRTVIQKNLQLAQRIENQSTYYTDFDDFYKTENKINKKEMQTARNFRSVIGTKKGKKHPFVKILSEKVAITMQYSGEICKINKDYYKEDYELNKKYLKYLKQYHNFTENHPDFDCVEAIKFFISNKKEFSEKEIIYFSNIPYYPAFAVKTSKGYIIYELSDNFHQLYEYRIGKKKNLNLKKIAINLQ